MRNRLSVASIAIVLTLGGCASMSEGNRTRDTAIGAGVGASAGAIIGPSPGSRADWPGGTGGRRNSRIRRRSNCGECVVEKNGKSEEGNGTSHDRYWRARREDRG